MREALKLALEALEVDAYVYNGEKSWKAIAAIKEALAQPEQESVPIDDYMNLMDKYVALLSAQPDPVAWGMPSAGGGFVVDCITPEEHDRVEGGYTVPLYTTPPQRTWVGLTLSDKEEYVAQDFGGNRLDAMDWAEQRLKEKNK